LKNLAAAASAVSDASPDECLALLGAVEEYPRWYPRSVREVEALERDERGRATRARVVLSVAIGPFTKELPFELTVAHEPDAVALTRIASGPSDRERFAVVWRVRPGPPTVLSIDLDADLDVPRLVPTGGVGAAIASSFVKAAAEEIERQRSG
jgi:hypothetical protein